ncbi:MAG: hypothetical protein AAF740_04535 [Bacteroidota bacterium]
MILEFYDRSGLLVNQNDFKYLEDVRFIKNQVEFLKPRVSYYFKLSNEEASELISLHEGRLLKNYKPEEGLEDFPEFSFSVFQLENNQVIIQQMDTAYLYEDIKALAFNDYRIKNLYYPEGSESGKNEFIDGNLPQEYNINSYFIYPKEAQKIIKSHQLKPEQENIQFDRVSKSILYLSPRGYSILLEDFEQTNPVTNDKLGIGSAHLFQTKEEFEERYTRLQNHRKKLDENPELRRGTHFYKELSDKYGKDFPNYTMQEINKLPSLLNFDSEELKFDKECLSILTEAIKWNYDPEEFVNQLIHPVLSYVGEYYKSRGKGDWKMKLDREGEVWEPWFTNSKGKALFDCMALYKSFYEVEYGIPGVEWYINGV